MVLLSPKNICSSWSWTNTVPFHSLPSPFHLRSASCSQRASSWPGNTSSAEGLMLYLRKAGLHHWPGNLWRNKDSLRQNYLPSWPLQKIFTGSRSKWLHWILLSWVYMYTAHWRVKWCSPEWESFVMDIRFTPVQGQIQEGGVAQSTPALIPAPPKV